MMSAHVYNAVNNYPGTQRNARSESLVHQHPARNLRAEIGPATLSKPSPTLHRDPDGASTPGAGIQLGLSPIIQLLGH